MTRKDLIKKMLLGGAVIAVVPSLASSCSKDNTGNPNTGGTTIDLTNPAYSALNTTGGWLVYKDIIVVNRGSGVFIALDALCTHAGCTISYSAAANNFPCPCHGSVFALSGSVLNGPATSPLTAHTVTKSGDILTIL